MTSISPNDYGTLYVPEYITQPTPYGTYILGYTFNKSQTETKMQTADKQLDQLNR